MYRCEQSVSQSAKLRLCEADRCFSDQQNCHRLQMAGVWTNCFILFLFHVKLISKIKDVWLHRRNQVANLNFNDCEECLKLREFSVASDFSDKTWSWSTFESTLCCWCCFSKGANGQQTFAPTLTPTVSVICTPSNTSIALTIHTCRRVYHTYTEQMPLELSELILLLFIIAFLIMYGLLASRYIWVVVNVYLVCACWRDGRNPLSLKRWNPRVEPANCWWFLFLSRSARNR